MKTILTIAGMILAATPAIAAQTPPPVNIIFSADNATCAAWTKSANNKPIRQQYEMWARGFVSGHNYANPARQVKVGAFPAGDDLYQYFDQYCRDNPQQSVVAGAIQLVEQLADAGTSRQTGLHPASAGKSRSSGKVIATPTIAD